MADEISSGLAGRGDSLESMLAVLREEHEKYGRTAQGFSRYQRPVCRSMVRPGRDAPDLIIGRGRFDHACRQPARVNRDRKQPAP